MPIYEFECNICAQRFEELVRSNSQDVCCPFCHARDIRRLMSSFAFSSKDASGNVTASSGCGGCSGGNCASCGGHG